MTELQLILNILIFVLSPIFGFLGWMLVQFINYKKESNSWKLEHSQNIIKIDGRMDKLEYRMDNNEKQLDKEEDEIKELIKDLHSKFKDS